MPTLALAGDVVERQTFLNGAVTLQLEGEGRLDAGIVGWSLVVTLPKAEADPIIEGDFTLWRAAEWLAVVVDGVHTADADEDTGIATHLLRLELRARGDESGEQRWQVGSLSLEFAGLEAHGELELPA